MNWEIQIDMYTLLCVKEIAAGKLLYSTESSAQCSVITERGRMKGWDGGSRSGGVGSDICILTAEFMQLYSSN